MFAFLNSQNVASSCWHTFFCLLVWSPTSCFSFIWKSKKFYSIGVFFSQTKGKIMWKDHVYWSCRNGSCKNEANGASWRKQDQEGWGSCWAPDEKAMQLDGHIPLPGAGKAQEGDASVNTPAWLMAFSHISPQNHPSLFSTSCSWDNNY